MPGKTRYIFKETDMLGPFDLDADTINAIVDDDAFGVYVLLRPSEAKEALVVYVGQGNVKDRLLSHASDGGGTHFAYKEVGSEIEAFAEECRLFHRYGKANYLDNIVHPPRPAGMPNLPKCSEKGCKGEAL